MTNVALSLIIGDIANPIVSFFVSTIITVIFGEIIPQAICSRYLLIKPRINHFHIIISKTTDQIRIISWIRTLVICVYNYDNPLTSSLSIRYATRLYSGLRSW